MGKINTRALVSLLLLCSIIILFITAIGMQFLDVIIDPEIIISEYLNPELQSSNFLTELQHIITAVHVIIGFVFSGLSIIHIIKNWGALKTYLKDGNKNHLTKIRFCDRMQQPTTNNQQPTTNNQQPTTNNQFYTSLLEGKVKRDIAGLEKRFSYENIVKNPSVQKYLLPLLRSQIRLSDKVLDFGCGSGVLLPIVSQFCAEVCGFDIVPGFVVLAKRLLIEQNIGNAIVYDDCEFNKTYKENCFDIIIINDVLHHMDNPSDAIERIHKLLKPEGRLIIMEPNRFNPAVFIFQAADPNERKWLKMGYFKYYEKITNKKFEIIKKDWLPLVYGPSSKIILLIAEFCEQFPFKLLRWGNPRLFLIYRVIK